MLMLLKEEDSLEVATSRVAKATRSIFLARTGSSAVAQSLLTKFAVLALNAATSILVARVLTPSGRGEMTAICLWPGFLSSLLTFGLPSSLTVRLRRSPATASETIAAAALLTLMIGIVTGIAGYPILPHWLNQYSAVDITRARWILLASPLPMLLTIGRTALEARGDFLSSNLSLWSAPVITLVALIALVVTGHATPLTCGVAYVLAVIPPAMFLCIRVRKLYAPAARGSGREMPRLLHFGLRAWGNDLLGALAVSEHVLVVHFLSAGDMGTYVVAANLARMLSVFQTSVVSVLFPQIASRPRNEVVDLTGSMFRISTACAAVCALMAGLGGPMILRVVYGSQYANAGASTFRLLLAEVVISGATQVVAQAYLALGRPGLVTLIQAFGVLTGLAMMPVLIRHLGGAGAPCALLVSSCIRLIITLAGLRLWLGVDSFRVVPDRVDLSFIKGRLPWAQDKGEVVAS